MTLAYLHLTLWQYLKFYQRYAYDFWEHLTPAQYGTILITVAVIGYLFMRSSNR